VHLLRVFVYHYGLGEVLMFTSVFSFLVSVVEGQFTLFLLCLSFFAFKLNRKSHKGVPTRLSHRSMFRALALLRFV
jgi:hypothetical protein